MRRARNFPKLHIVQPAKQYIHGLRLTVQQNNFCTCPFSLFGNSKNGINFTRTPPRLPNPLFEPHCAPSPTMGKKRTKAQNGAKPVFDEAALSKLTAKIDTDLANPKPKSNPKNQKQKEERPAKRKRSETDVKDATPNKRQAQEPKNRSAKPSKKPTKESKTPKDKKAELLQEILALGGDENDLDIIAGVDSDVEEGQGPRPKEAPVEMDKTLKNELAKFAAGLGFEKVRDEDAATDDDEEEVEEEESEAGEDEEEVEGEEWEDEPESEQDAKEPAAEKQSRSAAGKLVSMRHLGQTYLASTHH